MSQGVEGCVDPMAGRCDAWRSGLEGTGQRGRLVMEQWARKGLGRGVSCFFSVRLNVFAHKHECFSTNTLRKMEERGVGHQQGDKTVTVTFPESAMMPSAPPCPSGADSSRVISNRVTTPVIIVGVVVLFSIRAQPAHRMILCAFSAAPRCTEAAARRPGASGDSAVENCHE